ncbi:MAG: P-loop NTPase [Thermoplasmata archaeon]
MKTLLIVGLKGGTGKSMMAAMVAVYNAQLGKDTILVDADVDSPNLSEVMKVDARITVEPNKVEVVHLENLDFFSFGLLTKDKSVSMRGSSYVQMLLDVLRYADWKVNKNNALMVVDCPAGASDLFRGVLKAYYDTIIGALIVIIPSAWYDLKRLIGILNYYNVPIIGVVKNMAYFKCEHGKEYRIFGDGKIEEICNESKVEFLGEIPFSMEIRDVIEAGIPVVPSDIEPVLNRIIAKTEKMKPVGESILKRLTKTVTESVKKAMVKAVVNTIIKLNKSFDLKQIVSAGFGGNVIEFIVTSGNETVTQVYLKLTNDKLIVLKNPKEVDISIMADINALLKVAKGELDLETAYLMGDIEIYGSTATTRAFSFFQKLWKHMKDEIVEVVKDETSQIDYECR